LNESNVDTGKLVGECLSFISPRVREGNLKVTNLIEGRVPALIGEELAIKQILLNLLSNAVKFTPSGGRITLSYEVDGEGQMLLSITDTGVGLDETEIEKALSPFGQIDSALSRSGSGAGLGLTLVDSLIKLHGGRLELFSQKGIGTTATVIFPARRVVKDNKKAQTGDADPHPLDAPSQQESPAPRKLQ
jgi:signal transduction histidine kinase